MSLKYDARLMLGLNKLCTLCQTVHSAQVSEKNQQLSAFLLSLILKTITSTEVRVNIKLENVFMKHYAPNYTLASKQNISQIKAKP